MGQVHYSALRGDRYVAARCLPEGNRILDIMPGCCKGSDPESRMEGNPRIRTILHYCLATGRHAIPCPTTSTETCTMPNVPQSGMLILRCMRSQLHIAHGGLRKPPRSTCACQSAWEAARWIRHRYVTKQGKISRRQSLTLSDCAEPSQRWRRSKLIRSASAEGQSHMCVSHILLDPLTACSFLLLSLQ